MGFIKNLFSSPKKPKVKEPPKVESKAPQQAAADLQQRRALAKSDTVLTSSSGYGNVGRI